jgi:hypothetical protein
MNKHTFWMIIGCGLPLLLIFFAPAFGLGGGLSFLIFIIVMFACHLLMPMHHGGHQHNTNKEHTKISKNKSHESH